MPPTFRPALLLAAMTLPWLAACANDSTDYAPNPYYPPKPFLATDPGAMNLSGKEPALPNSPGYHEGGSSDAAIPKATPARP